MVGALAKRWCVVEKTTTTTTMTNSKVELDVHLCVERPARFVDAMADAGATRFIFQWEAMGSSSSTREEGDTKQQLQSALKLARDVKDAGMLCGVSINPSTPTSDILPLLESNLIDVVDVLAVEPGFGGQKFNPVALEKVSRLRRWRDEHYSQKASVKEGDDTTMFVDILVDGGIDGRTAGVVRDAGADILVAGTSLFRHPAGFEEAVEDLRRA